jgi:hypothetical protein
LSFGKGPDAVKAAEVWHRFFNRHSTEGELAVAEENAAAGGTATERKAIEVEAGARRVYARRDVVVKLFLGASFERLRKAKLEEAQLAEKEDMLLAHRGGATIMTAKQQAQGGGGGSSGSSSGGSGSNNQQQARADPFNSKSGQIAVSSFMASAGAKKGFGAGTVFFLFCCLFSSVLSLSSLVCVSSLLSLFVLALRLP